MMYGGTIMAKKTGIAEITDDFGLSCVVSVIGLPESTHTMYSTEQLQFEPVLPDGYSVESWTSSNERVAVVDETGLLTALGAGSATITLNMCNGVYSICDLEVKEIPSGITVSPAWLALGEREKARVKALSDGGSDLAFEYASTDESIAVVDEGGLVTAVSPGYAEIIVSLANRPDIFGSCPVMVLADGYTRGDFMSRYNNVASFYEMVLRSHNAFDEGYWDYNDEWVEPITVTRITQNVIASTYANLLGVNSSAPFKPFAEAQFAANQIMNNLAKRGGDTLLTIGKEEFMLIWDSVNLPYDLLTDLLEFVSVGEMDSIPLEKITPEIFSQWVDDHGVKIGLIEDIKDYVSPVTGFINVLKGFANFSSVDPDALRHVIDSLNQSHDDNVCVTAYLLDLMSTPEGLANYLTAIYGFEQGQGLLLKELKKEGYALLEFIPVVGWGFKGMEIGKDIAVTLNTALINIDDVQGAAYKFEYAVTMGRGMKSSFRETYDNYMACPVQPEKTKAFYHVADSFGLFVGMEYTQLGKIASALDDASISAFYRIMDGQSHQDFIELCNQCADYYPKALTDYIASIIEMMPDLSL